MDPQRLVWVRTGAPSGSGSGYLVGPQLVLTALHVVRVDGRWVGRVRVRVGHPRYGTDPVERTARVFWPDPQVGAPPAGAPDVALLWLDESVAISGGPVRWGRPGGVAPVPFEGAGFPAFAADDESPAQFEYLRGVLPAVSTSSSGWVLDCPVWPAPQRTGERPWAGASGSAIFCHGRLVGVAIEDNRAMGWRRLHAAPIHEALTKFDGFADLVTEYGHPGTTRASEEVTAEDAAGRSGSEKAVWGYAQGGPTRVDCTSAAVSGPVMLPPDPADLVGRHGPLEEVLAWLSPDPATDSGPPPGTAVVTAVAGMGGVGKSALVLHAAHKACQHGWFPGGILFADLRGYSTDAEVGPSAVADRFLRALGVKAEDLPTDTEGKLDTWRIVVNDLARQDRPLLIVLDNARSAGQVRPLLPGSPHRALVTSRQTLSALRGVRRITLEALEARHSLDLLERALRVDRAADDRVSDQREDALRLAALCGHLPLALHITAAHLRDIPSRSLATQVKALEDIHTRWDALTYHDQDSETSSLAVWATFELSYRHLDADQARAFRLLAAVPGVDISTDAAAVLLDRPDSDRLLARLASAHLVRPSSGDRWSMHDLVRLFADERGQAEADADGRKNALDRLLEHYYLSACGAASDLASGYRDPDRSAELVAALAWLDTERANLIAVIRTSTALDRPGISVNLAFVLAPYFDHRRHLDDWLSVSEIALDVMSSAGSLAGMADAETNHGNALAEVRRFDDALEAHNRALAYREQISDRFGQAESVGNLGSVRFHLRRFDEAIRDYTQAAQMFGELGESDRQASTLRNLVSVLTELRRFEEALSGLAEVADIQGDSGDAHALRSDWMLIGVIRAGLREFKGAIEAFNQAVEVSQQIADPHSEAAALTHIGNTLMAEWRIKEAITVHTRAAELLHETGDRHGEALARNSLGLCLLRMRRLEESVAAHTAAAEALRACYDAQGEGLALTNIGMALVQLNRIDEAMGAHSAAVEILRQANDPHGEGIALNNLGCALRRKGQFVAAIEDHEKAATLFRQTADRLSEADALNNIGVARKELLQFEEAVNAHTEAAKIYRDIADRPGEARASGNLAAALHATGRYEEAVVASHHAVEIFEAVGDLHGVASGYANIGAALIALGRFDDAIEACQKAVDLFRETDDPAGENVAYRNLWSAIYAKRDG